MQNGIAVAAARLRIGMFVAMAAVALLHLVARLGFPLGALHVAYRSHGLSPDAARLLADGTMLLLLVALARLTQMLRLIAAGEMFSARVIGRFRGFAFWLMMMAAFGFLAPLLAALGGAAASPGRHALTLAFDLRELLTLGITLVLFLIARLLERASEIEAEMREFV